MLLDDQEIAVALTRLRDRDRRADVPAGTGTQLGVKIKDAAFKSLVSVMLSAQSRDAMTARASAKLFARASTAKAILALDDDELMARIKDAGLYRIKARNLKAMCRALLERHGGEVPSSRAALMALPGVGRKSADIMLRFVSGEPAVPVDTHVFRVARRLGLAAGRSAAQLAAALEPRIPAAFRWGAHLWLLDHGKAVCRARRPRCAACFLGDLCPRNGLVDGRRAPRSG
jgi:endonuclease-3